MKDSTKETIFNASNASAPEEEISLSVVGKIVDGQFDGHVSINGPAGIVLKTALLGMLDMGFCKNGVYDIDAFEEFVSWATDEAVNNVLGSDKGDRWLNRLVMRWMTDNMDTEALSYLKEKNGQISKDIHEIRKYFLAKGLDGKGRFANIPNATKQAIDKFCEDVKGEDYEKPSPDEERLLEIAEETVMLGVERGLFTEEFIYTVNRYCIFIEMVIKAVEAAGLPYDGDLGELAEAILAPWDEGICEIIKKIESANIGNMSDEENDDVAYAGITESEIAEREKTMRELFDLWYKQWDEEDVLDVLKDEDGSVVLDGLKNENSVVSEENKNRMWFATMLIFQNCTAKHIDIPSSVLDAIDEKVHFFWDKMNDVIALITEEIMNFFVTEKHYSEETVYTLENFFKIQNFIMNHPDAVNKDVEASAEAFCTAIAGLGLGLADLK